MTKTEFIEKYGEEAYKQHQEYCKQYNKQHKDEIREAMKQYRERYREELKEHNKQYMKQYREEHKAKLNERNRKKKCMFAFCISGQWEQIENYELAKKDNFKGWCIHHRLETHNSDGERRLVNLTRNELKSLNMYYNRPASELIFLTKSEHAKLHRSKVK